MKTPGVLFQVLRTRACLLLAAGFSVSTQAAAPSLSVQWEGSNVVVNFTGRLEGASRVEGPYRNVVGARGAYRAQVAGAAQQYWRAVLDDVQMIAAGESHTVALRADGTLWSWGRNHFGQLGLGTTNDSGRPVQVGSDTNWRAVVLGPAASHTVAVRGDGTLWAWGNNSFGQLGLGTTNSAREPAQVGTDTNWLAAAVGNGHTIGLRTDGSLWAWGLNGSGQLGNGTTNSSTQPVRVGTSTNWRAVAAGYAHSAAVRDDGSVWAWGNNQSGQVDLTPFAPGSTNEPVQVGTNLNWQSVSAGFVHNLALNTSGRLSAWGSAGHGQLGTQTPASTTTWQAVSSGGLHTMAIRDDGTLWAWGRSFEGQLGHGNFFPLHPLVFYTYGAPWPIQVATNAGWLAVASGGFHTVALRDDGTLWSWGDNTYGQLGSEPIRRVTQPAQIGTNTNWREVWAGDGHTVALRDDGTAWTWGANRNGQLGHGTLAFANQPAPVASEAPWETIATGASASHTVAVRADGTLWTWGNNYSGQLGIGTYPSQTPILLPPPFGPYGTNQPVQVESDANWRAVSAGGDQTAALRADGTLWTWGATSPSTNRPVQVGDDANWQAVAAGGDHIVALRADGTLWAWGNNYAGQLGLGYFSTTQPTVVSQPTRVGTNTNWKSIATGFRRTLALRTDGTLWAWGENSSGQLGLGTTSNVNQPTQVGTDSDWQVIAAGGTHAAAIRTDGTLWTWGINQSGQLGNGTTINSSRPVQVGDEANWRAVAVGGERDARKGHTVAIRADGTLWAWGDNSYGQIAQSVSWLPNPVATEDWNPSAK